MKKVLIFSCLIIITTTAMSFKTVKNTGRQTGDFRVAILESEEDALRINLVADDISYDEESQFIAETPVRVLNNDGVVLDGTEVLICPGDGVKCKVKLTIDGHTGTFTLEKTKGMPNVLVKEIGD